ncbi:alkaline phosphatase PafA [Flammeovirga agarivorans]|uniref:Alkaline phosphatase family protein n=1 Tax=Flammeovirga agarivorans TaxID=2726742 RepID=A0A7X8SKC0_9BACT|nr:alkaline phosphatase PafA [Flammeovirga agarivorans]NLR91813.1 alkaline phosphatase family protein [Flammeovirga agarivorans]
MKRLSNKLNFFVLLSILCNYSIAQTPEENPKLIVGIVVDQMRYDYISRYWSKYSDGGFKRLFNEGFSTSNGYFNYAPTKTGPGHASIYTGTTPAYHGIVANEYYSRDEQKEVYCADDENENTIGADTQDGKMSPRRLMATTWTDELKLATNQQSKIISISMKNRGAVFPAGHLADGAFWLDDSTGNWISSSFYMDKLPQWVAEENEGKRRIDEFAAMKWETLLPMDAYTESISDDNNYEKLFPGEKTSTFPHDLKKIIKAAKKNKFGYVKKSPYGNTLTTELALKAIEVENLGRNSSTDALLLSYSSTDKIGHMFAPASIEVEDTYLRLDLELKELFETLDKKIGMENVVIFLTADHGGSHNPQYLKDLKLPSDFYDEEAILAEVENELSKTYGAGKWIVYGGVSEIYLNRPLIKQKGLQLIEVQTKVADLMLSHSCFRDVLIGENLRLNEYQKGYTALYDNSYNVRNSPDVIGVFAGNYYDKHSKKGTGHSTAFTYDTHIPIMMMGWKIPHKVSDQKVYITDIAPTICSFLHINPPSACYYNPIQGILK